MSTKLLKVSLVKCMRILNILLERSALSVRLFLRGSSSFGCAWIKNDEEPAEWNKTLETISRQSGNHSCFISVCARRATPETALIKNYHVFVLCALRTNEYVASTNIQWYCRNNWYLPITLACLEIQHNYELHTFSTKSSRAYKIIFDTILMWTNRGVRWKS